MKFVDVKKDIAFRKLFGNQNKKIILISFLNAILKRVEKNLIVDVDIQDSYRWPIIKNLRDTIIGVKAKDINGNTYIIEMQVSQPEGLDIRLQYYASNEFAQQIESGENYSQLKSIIFIGIFDFNITKTNKYYSHNTISDIETQERFLTDIDYFFIELPKFKKEINELVEIMDKWIYFIKNAQNLEKVPENVQDLGLIEAYEDAKKFNWNKKELNDYDYAAMREQDERGKLILAINRAEEKGRQEGIQEGKKEFLLKLHRKGYTTEKIADLLGIEFSDLLELERNIAMKIITSIRT